MDVQGEGRTARTFHDLSVPRPGRAVSAYGAGPLSSVAPLPRTGRYVCGDTAPSSCSGPAHSALFIQHAGATIAADRSGATSAFCHRVCVEQAVDVLGGTAASNDWT